MQHNIKYGYIILSCRPPVNYNKKTCISVVVATKDPNTLFKGFFVKWFDTVSQKPIGKFLPVARATVKDCESVQVIYQINQFSQFSISSIRIKTLKLHGKFVLQNYFD